MAGGNTTLPSPGVSKSYEAVWCEHITGRKPSEKNSMSKG